ncbi:right-handed parallel beta-helix repeat-containing protein [Actinopolymorpha rutila]|uniref:Right handed beta helix region n=1 Tax=Actinopolymorpha rutila TaxID=446787 RepID=A0A852Z8J4_9ACTN|nr:right-handed parallel beta-helix repeat-containing protein [Actinopolymorpha rutila]NYH88545.1 hypothetical protein [Actinopolymorpha rutila]
MDPHRLWRTRRELLRDAGLVGTGLAAAAAGVLPAGPASAAPPGVRNLPRSWYDRPGLEGMPRIDYESMPVENVRDHGAVGDGRTPDRAAFDAAVDALQAKGGGVVYLPTGRYLFPPPPPPTPHYWLRDLTNIHFVGEGESSVVVFEQPGITGPNDYAPKYTFTQGWAFPNVVNVSLRALSLTWTPLSQMRDGRPWYAIVLDGGQGAQFVGVHVDGGQPGIWIPGGRDKWVVDCVVRNTASDAIHFQGATRSVGAYNYVENANDDALANFTNTADTPDTTKIGDVRFAYNTVVFVGWGRGLTFGGSRQRIDHNWVEAQVEAGIYTDVGIFEGAPNAPLYDAAAQDNTLVRTNLAQREDNAFYRYGTGGYQGAICVRDEVRGMRVERNRIAGSGVHGMTFGIEGWRPFDGTDVVVDSNVVERPLGTGIRFIQTATADRIRFAGNEILDTGTASVSVEGTLTHVTTRDNEVTTPPSVTGSVSGDFDGFTVVDDEPRYRDAYHDFRVAADETGWSQPPSGPRISPRTAVADVRRFGARGDGRGNDLPAFERALRSLPASGGVLRIPAGTFVLRPPTGPDAYPDTRIRHHLLVAGRDDLRVEGVGEDSVLVFTSADHQGIRFVDCTRVALAGVRLELRPSTPLRHNRALVELSATRDSVVEHVTAAGSSGPGVLVDSSRSVAVRDSRVQRAGTHGIEIAASRQVFVDNCTVTDARDHGIFLSWLGSIACAPQYVRFSGNRVAGTREGAGVAVIGGDHVSVADNAVDRSYLAGIYLYSRCGNFPPGRVEVTGNVLSDTNTGRLSHTPGAIAVHSLQRGRTSADVLLAGNTIRRTPYAGIWVGGPTPIGTKLADLARLELRDNPVTEAGGPPVDISAAQREHIDHLQI